MVISYKLCLEIAKQLDKALTYVNCLWLDSAIRADPAITLENHVKLERNRQIEGLIYDTTSQPGETIATLAMVSKIDYTKKLDIFAERQI